jgi:tRNA modification GTPase
MLLEEDTIVALATPAGRGALAVIRISGDEALVIGRRILNPWPGESRRATVSSVHDPVTRDRIDQVVVTTFEGPRSYTGEDVVELSGHGGFVAPEAVLTAVIRAGARVARPGEFTQRALLHGKLDLLQAEAIADLVDARTDAMRRTALSQLEGGLSLALTEIRRLLLELEALLAYQIDFPEEDDGPVPNERLAQTCADIERRLGVLLGTSNLGQLIRVGAAVVIAGAPNVGKSSLFNALLGERRAIVTEVPGTTRDALEASIESGTTPLRIIDTAGLRADAESIERLGIEMSFERIAEAHIVLACGDTTERIDAAVAQLTGRTQATILRVQTKADHGTPWITGVDARVSARDRLGLQELVDAVAQTIERQFGSVASGTPTLTRARHQLALQQALDEIRCFRDLLREGTVPASVAAVHVRSAVHALDELIGRVDVEDILSAVFAEFCIGK